MTLFMMTIDEVMETIEGRGRKREFFHVQNSYDSVIVPYTCFLQYMFYFGFSL